MTLRIAAGIPSLFRSPPLTHRAGHTVVNFGANRERKYTDVFRQKDAVSSGYGSYQYIAKPRDPDMHVMMALGEFCQPGDAVLELGMNCGNNAIRMANIGYRVFGMDIAPRALAAIPRQQQLLYPERLHAALWDFAEQPSRLPPEWATQLPEQGPNFKAIVAVHTLSHLSNERLIQTMQGYIQHLQPGGIIVATVVRPTHLAGQRVEDHQTIQYGFTEHSQETLDKAFAGLELQGEWSRPFEAREPVGWNLPRQQVHWVVYRKPLATGPTELQA